MSSAPCMRCLEAESLKGTSLHMNTWKCPLWSDQCRQCYQPAWAYTIENTKRTNVLFMRLFVCLCCPACDTFYSVASLTRLSLFYCVDSVVISSEDCFIIVNCIALYSELYCIILWIVLYYIVSCIVLYSELYCIIEWIVLHYIVNCIVLYSELYCII